MLRKLSFALATATVINVYANQDTFDRYDAACDSYYQALRRYDDARYHDFVEEEFTDSAMDFHANYLSYKQEFEKQSELLSGLEDEVNNTNTTNKLLLGIAAISYLISLKTSTKPSA